jgi:hypothetical protein
MVTALSFTEPVCIEGVNLRSDNEDLVGVVTIREEEDASALMKAKEIAETVTYSLILSTNVGLSLEDIWISSKVADQRQGNLHEVFEFVRVRDKVKVGVIPSKESLDNLAKYVGALRNLSDQEREFATRVLDWYSKGAMEEDPVDKFIAWYISLDALGGYRYPSDGLTKRVQKIIADLKENESINEKKLTEFRGALFHSGRREDEAIKYCSGLDAIILRGIRNMM